VEYEEVKHVLGGKRAVVIDSGSSSTVGGGRVKTTRD